jgi:hypothetical protein
MSERNIGRGRAQTVSSRLVHFTRIERLKKMSPASEALIKRGESRGSIARVKAFLNIDRYSCQGVERFDKL